ncbi:MAG: hypothetical protein RSF90_02765, partial [Pygmaiobacter sp.]
MLEQLIESGLPIVISMIEFFGIFVVTVSTLRAFWLYLANLFGHSGRHNVKFELASGLATGLEFKMAAEILTRRLPTGKDAMMLSHISSSADRAHRMIADLLDFALARVGRGISISASTIDLHSVTAQSIAELRVTFPDATLIHQGSETGRFKLDADRLQQIIGNLVANSVAYGDLQRPITVVSRVES